MKHIKKILLFLIVPIMIAGCSKSNNTNDSSDNNKTKISIVQYKVEIVDALNNAISMYEEENQNIDIVLETIGGGDDIGPILKSRLQSNTLPTIFNIGGPSDVSLYESHLEDLSDQNWINNIPDELLVNVSKDNKIYGLPYAIEGFGFIFNKDIFIDSGVDINSLNSFESISDAFEKVNTAINNGSLSEKYPNLECVVELPGAEAWVLGDHASNVALAPEFFFDPFKAHSSSRPEWLFGDSYKQIIDLQIKYSNHANNPSSSLAVTYADQVQSGLALERVACIQQGNWIYNDVKNIDEDVAEKLDILPLPTIGSREDSIYTLVPMYWCVSKDASENEKAEAKKFLSWLYRSNDGKEIIVNEFGFIPPFDDYDIFPNNQLAESIKKYEEAGKASSAVFKGYPDGWATNVIGSNIQGYLSGNSTWDEALTNAADNWEKLRTNN